MFIKPYKKKSSTLLKSSERKKIRSRLRLQYPSLSDDQLDEICPVKSDVTLCKLIAHSGLSVDLYVIQDRPVLFQLPQKSDVTLCPTLFLLIQFPFLLPTVTTHSMVVDKLAQGADLMLPGVVPVHGGKLSSMSFERGDVVAVNTVDNRCPVAVGFALYSSEELQTSCGGVGKALQICHVKGDFLAKFYPTAPLVIPEISPCQVHPATILDANSSSIPEDIAKEDVQHLEDSLAKYSLAEVDLDQVVIEACCRALKLLSVALANDQISLPIASSQFYRTHLLDQIESNIRLDIKKTRFKRLATFLGEMASRGLMEVKPHQHGDELIVHINANHPDIVHAKPIKKNHGHKVDGDTDKKTTYIRLTTVYFATKANASFLNRLTSASKLTSPYTVGQLRELVAKYVGDNSLAVAEDHKMLVLDDQMCKAFPTKDRLFSWPKLMEHVQSHMSCGYRRDLLDHQDQSASVISSSVHKGKMPQVHVSCRKAGPGKMVTLVQQLHLFEIDLPAFAHACQVAAASSASVNTNPTHMPIGSTEILVQGQKQAVVCELLVNQFGVQRKDIAGYVEGRKAKNGRT